MRVVTINIAKFAHSIRGLLADNVKPSPELQVEAARLASDGQINFTARDKQFFQFIVDGIVNGSHPHPEGEYQIMLDVPASPSNSEIQVREYWLLALSALEHFHTKHGNTLEPELLHNYEVVFYMGFRDMLHLAIALSARTPEQREAIAGELAAELNTFFKPETLDAKMNAVREKIRTAEITELDKALRNFFEVPPNKPTTH